MVRRATSRHARPSGRGALAAAYDDLRHELHTVRSQRYAGELETLRLQSLTETLSGQVAGLQHELVAVRRELETVRSRPAPMVERPAPIIVTVPAAEPAPAPPAAQPGLAEQVLVSELAEMRRLVAHQQQMLGDLTVRLLTLLERFVPVAPSAAAPVAPPAQAPEARPAQPTRGYPAPAPSPAAAPDLVMDDETATRLRVIREAFGR